MVTTGQVHVAGEVTTSAYADIPTIVRETVLGIGYDSSAKGFDGASCGVNVAIGAQSPDIAQGVDTAYEARTHCAEEIDDALDRQGAGDQGLMFGYACTDTPELMPLPIALAHRLARGLTGVRKSGAVPYLRPDGKTQVTIEYVGDRAVRLDTVVVSSQHAENIDLEQLLAVDIREQVVEPELAALDIDTTGYRLLVNPTGRFVIGGPMGDAGLTGRKIIVDTYGGMARHGGGAFSGKDPSKVDRSARVRDALGGQERGRRRAGGPDRGAGRLRDRQGLPGRAVRRDLRHRAGRPGQDRRRHPAGLRPAAGRDHPRPGPQAPDLRADRRLRPLRPHRRRPALGEHQPGRGPQVRPRHLTHPPQPPRINFHRADELAALGLA